MSYPSGSALRYGSNFLSKPDLFVFLLRFQTILFFFFTIFSRDVQIVYRLDFCCLCYRTTTLVSILFTRLWSVGTVMAFRYKGKLVTSQQNFYFFLSSVFSFFLAVWLLYLHGQS